MKGLIFKPELAQAIYEGRCTQTRRVIKPQPVFLSSGGLDKHWFWEVTCGDYYECEDGNRLKLDLLKYGKPRFQVGDLFYVKETWNWRSKQTHIYINNPGTVDCLPDWAELIYKANGGQIRKIDRWISPLFMPEWAARSICEVTGVRVEQVQDISYNDWVADFCPSNFEKEKALQTFVGYTNQKEMAKTLWDSINPKYPWSSNPFNFVFEFKRNAIKKGGAE